ncbi:hypothetical protein JCM14467A_08170 [Vulcanisaeta sp. JCM 14467]
MFHLRSTVVGILGGFREMSDRISRSMNVVRPGRFYVLFNHVDRKVMVATK